MKKNSVPLLLVLRSMSPYRRPCLAPSVLSCPWAAAVLSRLRHLVPATLSCPVFTLVLALPSRPGSAVLSWLRHLVLATALPCPGFAVSSWLCRLVSTLLILVGKDIITAVARASPIRPPFFSFFYFLCIVFLILLVANKRSSRFPTGVTGLFAIESGNSPCCKIT